MLQWGRAHVSAETAQSGAGFEGAGLASMGPRSRERGNSVQKRVESSKQAALQWGRAHVSAETSLLVVSS